MRIEGLERAIAGWMTRLGWARERRPLEVGAEVPGLSDPLNDTGERVPLAAWLGEGPTLVFFFPRARTPGCTRQGCEIQAGQGHWIRAGLRVVGVSGDPAPALNRFRREQGFAFVLISDPAQAVMEAFGVGTIVGNLARRHAFLVQFGRVRWRCLDCDPTQFAARLEEQLKEMAEPGEG